MPWHDYRKTLKTEPHRNILLNVTHCIIEKMPVSPGSLLVPFRMGRNSLACEQVLEQKRWKSEGYHLILGLLPIRKDSREHWLMSGDNILEYASALISCIYHLSLVLLRHSITLRMVGLLWKRNCLIFIFQIWLLQSNAEKQLWKVKLLMCKTQALWEEKSISKIQREIPEGAVPKVNPTTVEMKKRIDDQS